MGFLRRPQNLKKSSSYFWQEHRVLCSQQLTCQKVDWLSFGECIARVKLELTDFSQFRFQNLVGTNPNRFHIVPAGLPVWLRIKRKTAFTSKQVKPASATHFTRFSWIYFLLQISLKLFTVSFWPRTIQTLVLTVFIF